MFEHPSHHPDMRQWEVEKRFSLDPARSEILIQEFHATMDKILEGRISPFDDGEDHRVFYHESSIDDPFVVKHLKPSSREVLVLGMGVSPEKVRELKNQGQQINIRSLDTTSMVLDMQLAHTVIASQITQYKFLPTAIISYRNEIFRFQRYIQRPNPHLDPMLLPLTMQFYETLKMRWPHVQQSEAFRSLPPRIQKYYEYFGIDDGVYTNAIFRGFMGPQSNPEFIVIDY